MTTTLDTRWRQRLDNFDKAYAKLSEAVVLLQEFEGTAPAQYDLMCEGIVQRLEFTHELAWNVMKDSILTDFYKVMHTIVEPSNRQRPIGANRQ